jgi:hypothetical protein
VHVPLVQVYCHSPLRYKDTKKHTGMTSVRGVYTHDINCPMAAPNLRRMRISFPDHSVADWYTMATEIACVCGAIALMILFVLAMIVQCYGLTWIFMHSTPLQAFHFVPPSSTCVRNGSSNSSSSSGNAPVDVLDEEFITLQHNVNAIRTIALVFSALSTTVFRCDVGVHKYRLLVLYSIVWITAIVLIALRQQELYHHIMTLASLRYWALVTLIHIFSIYVRVYIDNGIVSTGAAMRKRTRAMA